MNTMYRKSVVARFTELSSLLTTIYLLLTTIYHCEAADWRAFMKTPQRNGIATEQASPNLSLMWKFDNGGGAFVSSPIVYKDKVYIGSEGGDVFAIDAYTGTLIWQYSTDGKVRSTPAAYNDVIYVSSQDGNLYAFDANKESLIWRYSTGSKDCSSPVVDNNRVYCASGFSDQSVYCLDATSGNLIWKTQLDKYVYSSPVVKDGVVYIGCNNGKFYALDAGTGAVKWEYKTDGTVYMSTMTVISGVAYGISGNDDRKVYAIDINTGSLKSGWQQYDVVASSSGDPFTSIVSSISAGDETIYLGATGVSLTPNWVSVPVYNLYAINSSDGTKKWGIKLDMASKLGIVSSPVLANDIIYVGSAVGAEIDSDGDGWVDTYRCDTGKLYAISSSDGSILWQTTLDMPVLSTPCVSNGWVYVGAGDRYDGYLYGFKAEKIASISSPDENSSVVRGTVIEFKGSAVNPNLTSYKLEYKTDTSGIWTTISTNNSSVENTTLGTLYTGNFAPGILDVRLTINNSTNNMATIQLSLSQLFKLIRQKILAGVGGTLTTSEGTIIIIPPNSLYTDDYVSVDTPTSYPNTDTLTTKYVLTNVLREFSVEETANQTFQKPVTVVIPYTESQVSSFEKEDLRIYYWDSSANKWELLADSVVNTSDRYVMGNTTHFSIFRIGDINTAYSEHSVSAATGGTLSSLDGTTVIFSAGALSLDDNLIIQEPLTYSSSGISGNIYTPFNIVREFILSKEENTLFSKSVTIKIPYKTSEIGDTDESSLRLNYWNENTQTWDLILDSYPDTQNKLVVAEVNHFSLYRVSGLSSSYAQGAISAASGGTLTSADGTSVIFEPGALSEDDTITIQTPASYSDEGISQFYKKTGVVREFLVTKPANATFNKLVTIKIPYKDSEVGGMNKEKLRICWRNSSKNKWQMLNSSSPLTNESKIKGKVSRFSVYRVFEYVGGEELINKTTVYTYPNPALGDSVTFKCYLGDDADVTIDVFNISGQKIAHLENSGIAGVTLETTFDITNIASGVYIYKFEAKSKNTGRSKYVVKKFAIVH